MILTGPQIESLAQFAGRNKSAAILSLGNNFKAAILVCNLEDFRFTVITQDGEILHGADMVAFLQKET